MDANPFKTVNRGGNIFITQNSDLYTAHYFETQPKSAYHVLFYTTAARVGTITGAIIQAAAYWRRALFRTDANNVITQVGSTQTPAADLEDAAGWQCLIVPDVANKRILCQVAADGTPTNWQTWAEIFVADTMAVAGGF